MTQEPVVSVEYDSALCIVRCKLTGPIAAAYVGRMAQDGLHMAREHGCPRFIVDYRDGKVVDTTLDTFEFMAHLEHMGFTSSDRIALVYAQDGEAHRFAELVAHNRGWINIRYFEDYEAAEAWILQPRSDPK